MGRGILASVPEGGVSVREVSFLGALLAAYDVDPSVAHVDNRSCGGGGGGGDAPITGGGGGVGGAHFTHSRSCMTIDPRIPTVPGRSMSGFHRAGRHRVHQARSAVRCLASRMQGELHRAKNYLSGELLHLVRTSLHGRLKL